jgi:hypothetical protein
MQDQHSTTTARPFPTTEEEHAQDMLALLEQN